MGKGKFTVVTSEDWEGLYEDGRLVTQAHLIDWRELYMELVGADEVSADEDWLYGIGQLPERLSEVVRDD